MNKSFLSLSNLLVRAALEGGGAKYWQRLKSIFGSAIVSYLPLSESSGAIAADLSGNSRTGAYINCTLANAIGPDNQPIPYLDGSTSLINWYTASLLSAFPGAEGTLLIGGAVPEAVWTDGVTRRLLYFEVDANNFIGINRTPTNNQMSLSRRGGGSAAKTTLINSLTTTNIMQFGLTWSESADEVICYYNGAQSGAKLTGLGAWTGSLNADRMCIGALRKTSPIQMWLGWVWTAVILNRPATPLEMQAVYL